MDYKKLYSKLTQIKSGQKFISKAAYGAKMQTAKQEDKKELSGQYIQLDLQEVEAIEKYGISQLLDDSAKAKYTSFKTESPVAAGVDLSFAKDDEFKRHVILYALTQDKFEELISGDESTPQANLEANLDIITKIYKKTDDLEHKKFDAYFNKVRDDQKGQKNWFKIGIDDLKPRIKLLEQESFKGFEHLLDHKDARLAIKVLSEHEKLNGRGSEFSDLDKYIEGLCRVKFADSYDAISTSALGEPRKKELEGFIVDYFKAYSKGTNVSPDTTIEEGIKRSIDSVLSKPEQAEALPDVSVQYEKLDGNTLESLLNEQTKGYSIKRLPKSDLRGYYLGALTNSCQSMHGHGHDFAKLGMEDEDSGFYVLEKDGRIVGQAFSWKGEDRKSLVFDSIETLGDEHQTPAAILFMKLAKKIIDNKEGYGIEQVRIGLGGQTPKVFSKFLSWEYSKHPKESIVNFYDSRSQASITDMAKNSDVYKYLAANCLLEASKVGNLELVEKLINKGDLLDFGDCAKTALHLAAKAGHKDIFLKLIEKMTPDKIAADDEDYRTALHYAAEAGHKDMVLELIEKMTPDKIAAADKFGKTALHLAAKAGCTDIALKLIEKMTPDEIVAADKFGKTALYLAEEAGHKETALKLIEKMTPQQHAVENACALRLAAENDDKDTALKLIEKMTPDKIAAADRYGQTALHFAAKAGHTEIALKLIEKMTPDQIAAKDRDGKTAMDLAPQIAESMNKKMRLIQLQMLELVESIKTMIEDGRIKPKELGAYEEKPDGTKHYNKPEQLTIKQLADLLDAHKQKELFAKGVAETYADALKTNPAPNKPRCSGRIKRVIHKGV